MKPLRLIFAALILTSPLLAQSESGVSLTIRFADGTNRFHVGEIIPVELLFKPSVPDTYDMEMRNKDRSGRLNIEAFHVMPPAGTHSNATIPQVHSWAVAWAVHVNSPASRKSCAKS